MTTIRNRYGRQIDFDAAAMLMDHDISSEMQHGLGLSEEDFFRLYCEKHRAKHGAEFEPNRPNPTW